MVVDTVVDSTVDVARAVAVEVVSRRVLLVGVAVVRAVEVISRVEALGGSLRSLWSLLQAGPSQLPQPPYEGCSAILLILVASSGLSPAAWVITGPSPLQQWCHRKTSCTSPVPSCTQINRHGQLEVSEEIFEEQ
ncbi:hypothetical protein DUI87_22519 [Hirundo rustica rustica]|uniref:Uncharacterized protein n=1 Tax=Hirundo rustica rustica TaxID=333673 RepID=A0A3M0JP55_HIRRU|nr:hypothetical protein DUI87_22519 [Hirundo rustica rustica]